MERIMKTRLENIVEPQLHPNLFGFRRKRGTADALACVAQIISRAIYKGKKVRKKRQCTAVFIDLEKAFELANPTIIVYEMAKMGVKGKLLAYVQDYLSNRTGTVTFQNATSRIKDFENGTPQGGVLSPLLFNVLINSVFKIKLKKGVHLYSYADDLVLLCSGPCQHKHIQNALTEIEKKCITLGLKINITKTKAMEFKHNRYNVDKGSSNTPKPLFINGLKLDYVREYKYLGVILTPLLSMKKHVKHSIKKAWSRFNALRCLAGKTWGAEVKTMVRYVNMSIRPILEYGAPVLFTSHRNVNAFGELEVYYRKCLRYALNLPSSTPNHLVYLEAGSEPLINRVIKHSLNVVTRIKEYDMPHPLHSFITDYVKTYVHTYKDWQSDVDNIVFMERVMDHMKDVPGYYNFLQNIDTQPLPLNYSQKQELNENIIITGLDCKKSDLTTEQIQHINTEHIQLLHTYPKNTMILYTDGSVNEDKDMMTYGVVPTYARVTNGEHNLYVCTDHIITGQIISPNFTPSSMQTELIAIWQALIKASLYEGVHFVIFSDSMSALSAIRKSHNDDHHWIIYNIQQQYKALRIQNKLIQINWVPSHLGIQGNELADQVAATLQHTCPDKVAHDIINISPPPSVRDYKLYSNNKITENWRNNIKWGSHNTYKDMNPDFKLPNINSMSRILQVRILHLRVNAHNQCPYRCINTCSYCGEPYTSTHYMLQCPHTQNYRNALEFQLEAHQVLYTQDRQASLILHSENAQGYPVIKDMLKNVPPKFECNGAHTESERYPWYIHNSSSP